MRNLLARIDVIRQFGTEILFLVYDPLMGKTYVVLE